MATFDDSGDNTPRADAIFLDLPVTVEFGLGAKLNLKDVCFSRTGIEG